MVRRLAKQLIVPKTNPSITEQLTGNHPKCGVPNRIVKCFGYPPMSKGME
jgi:hypothetical protein